MGLLSARVAEAIRLGKPFRLLVEIDHPDGLARAWSGIGQLTYNGHTWTGIGTLGRITGVNKSTAIAIAEATFELAGVPPTSDTWLSANVRNRVGRAWLAWIERRKVIGDPCLLIEVQLDYPGLGVDASRNATLRLVGAAGWWTVERAQNLAWTHEWQISQFPSDTGLSLIPSLTSKQSQWRQS